MKNVKKMKNFAQKPVNFKNEFLLKIICLFVNTNLRKGLGEKGNSREKKFSLLKGVPE